MLASLNRQIATWVSEENLLTLREKFFLAMRQRAAEARRSAIASAKKEQAASMEGNNMKETPVVRESGGSSGTPAVSVPTADKAHGTQATGSPEQKIPVAPVTRATSQSSPMPKPTAPPKQESATPPTSTATAAVRAAGPTGQPTELLSKTASTPMETRASDGQKQPALISHGQTPSK